jgi:lipopolysaccharide biosynthesis protein
LKTPLPRLIAYYLPQFHPVPENDAWWGRGFTEWRNTAKARPLFPCHYQPHHPADLGFYDLRVPETRQAQADLARQYGIEGFCYYHYWFGDGRELLERPLQEVVDSGSPDFPFCICWANESWTGVWHGLDKQTLIEQRYPGPEDDQAHFDRLLKAFKDPRYMRVDGRPIFVVYAPQYLPDATAFVERWQTMARRAGLSGLYLVGVRRKDQAAPEAHGFDGSIYHHFGKRRPPPSWRNPLEAIRGLILDLLRIPSLVSYERAISHSLPSHAEETIFPNVVHAWDNTPRSGSRGLVLTGSSPDMFRRMLRRAFEFTRVTRRTPDSRLIFLKSWNEWAEGNHLEPDLKYGHAYLQVIKDELAHETERSSA